ncbi:TPA: 50S ribosomal protein L19e [Candidatus Thalassarchaeaceae archaeon]|jgi:large subunit ribosomal protein L19e|nr:50S ribosomal protein L19e [Euryarchaeota archaeon]MDC3310088.1 50S ribosomal protein L19e [Candidatus Poseidoniales archaeon]MDG1542888.1 50S ribosomal protein L19e [Candidatus Thalassarchaeaceae archaeon]MBT3846735.1 50S ribosomal protein L19e [Euryarchaeota archaeon]MBT4156433.1 50S ribosomal protein L19e [Euryarchaeota archaeon]|tara:strand:+ start:1525 stop:2001 length:477 start_codon:yes stop_codon:yes gene_type:complete
MIISNQKRMAAQILSKKEGRTVGIHRVWINPDYLDEVSTAVQKDDIRQLIEDGLIKARPIKGISKGRARKAAEQKAKGRRKGPGSRKGTRNSRDPKKNRWMRLIRAQRRVLKDLRGDETLTPSEYRYYYRKAKGGSYRSVSHMRTNMGLDGIKFGGDE